MQDSNIHIKLDSSEVVETKKNLLLLEKELLESIRHLKKYRVLRKDEIALKTLVKSDLSELKSVVGSVEHNLPEEQAEFAPEKYTKEASEKHLKKAVKKNAVEKRRSDVEAQIDEIRRKLSQLGAEEGL